MSTSARASRATAAAEQRIQSRSADSHQLTDRESCVCREAAGQRESQSWMRPRLAKWFARTTNERTPDLLLLLLLLQPPPLLFSLVAASVGDLWAKY